MPQEEREAEQESGEDSDEWTDEEDADTPIDELDPFMLFSNTLQQLQTQNPGRFQVGTLTLGLSTPKALSRLPCAFLSYASHVLLCTRKTIALAHKRKDASSAYSTYGAGCLLLLRILLGEAHKTYLRLKSCKRLCASCACRALDGFASCCR